MIIEVMDQAIELRGLTKTYPGATSAAVDGLDLSVGRGEIVALLGPNGAGKTTTLDMVLGFIPPTSGSLAVFGVDPAQAIQEGRVSAVLQTGGLLRDLRVGETLELVASLYDDPPSVSAILLRTGLAALSDRKVQACSGGEQQRLRFALALLADPDLLVLDEPTAGMDVEARRDFWATMREEAAEGRTVIFATHYLQEAEDFAERTVLLASGRIVADGPTDEIRRLGSARRVIARIPPDRIDACAAALSAHSAVRDLAVEAGKLEIESSDSDTIARLLLVDYDASELEVAAMSLETAFINLTSSDADTPTDRSGITS